VKCLKDVSPICTVSSVYNYIQYGEAKEESFSPDCQPSESGLREAYPTIHSKRCKSNKRPMGIRSAVHAGIHESLRSVFSLFVCKTYDGIEAYLKSNSSTTLGRRTTAGA